MNEGNHIHYSLKIFVLHFYWNVYNWVLKLIWSRMDYFWGFLLQYASFRRFHLCFDWNLQWIAQVWFSSDDIKSVWYFVWGVFWCVLYLCPHFLALGFSNVDRCVSSMQSNFISYVRASSILVFPQVMIDFWYNCITCKSGNFFCGKMRVKKPHTLFLPAILLFFPANRMYFCL